VSNEGMDEEELCERGEAGRDATEELHDAFRIMAQSRPRYDTGFVSSQSVQQENRQLGKKGTEVPGGHWRGD